VELDRRTLSGLISEAAERAATEGVPASTARQLDDENPVIPLAVDGDGDVAMVTLLSWSEQDSGWEPSLWNVDLLQHDSTWYRVAASGGLPPRDYPLATRRPAEPAGLHIRVYQAGPQHSMTGDTNWLTAAIHVTAEVETLRIGDRIRPVPFHGYLPVVARNRARAIAAGVGGDGSVLETLDLRRDASDLYRELRHRDPVSWPFQITRAG
jgi:hypothetical protein